MVTEDEFLTELRQGLKSGDLRKVQLVIIHLGGQSKDLQQAVISELEQQPPSVSIPMLGVMLDLRIGDLAISRTDIAKITAARVMEAPEQLKALSSDACIQVVTALGQSGDTRALRCLRQLLVSEPPSANLRFTAYEALGLLPLLGGGYMLAAGLEDPDASVRIAAARAIEKNHDDNLCEGIRNLVSAEDDTARKIVAALSQAGALTVIETLLADDPFTRLLLDYLEETPDPELLSSLRPALERSNRRSLLALVDRFLDASQSDHHPTIYAVDDSPTVLRMYRAALGATGCNLRTFDNPFEAIEHIAVEPPDLLFTDLNMPEIDGIELASTLRSNPRIPDFPIVMVTTQGEGLDIETARYAGVDGFIQKPFTAGQLVDAVNAMTEYVI